jgi:hypothetical protein
LTPLQTATDHMTDLQPQFWSVLLGAAVSLSATLFAWHLRERSDRKRLRSEKLELLIKTIHRANILAVANEGGYRAPQAERETENAVNEVDLLVSLHFPVLKPLSDRVGKAFTLTLTTPSQRALVSELRGLEQDVMIAWRGGEKDVMNPQRKLPSLDV